MICIKGQGQPLLTSPLFLHIRVKWSGGESGPFGMSVIGSIENRIQAVDAEAALAVPLVDHTGGLNRFTIHLRKEG